MGPEEPRGFQEVTFLRFHDNGTGWWWVVSLTHRPPLPAGILLPAASLARLAAGSNIGLINT